jgi:HK97 gp10 family phage protein
MIELKFKFDDKDLQILNPDSFKFANELDKAIKKYALEIRNTAVQTISRGARTGKFYKRRSIIHQASSPGEFPKTDTGRLVSSIRTDFRFLEADIGSDVNYSQYLEKGTTKMKPRPWLEPSLETQREWMIEEINTVIKKAFNL